MENRPRPNLVGSPKMDTQSSENHKSVTVDSKWNSIITVIVCIQYHLKNTKDAADNIQEYAANAPSDCTFPSIIHYSLCKCEIEVLSNTRVLVLVY